MPPPPHLRKRQVPLEQSPPGGLIISRQGSLLRYLPFLLNGRTGAGFALAFAAACFFLRSVDFGDLSPMEYPLSSSGGKSDPTPL